jgi:hypothetical protein
MSTNWFGHMFLVSPNESVIVRICGVRRVFEIYTNLSFHCVLLVWDFLVHSLPIEQVHAAPYIVDRCRLIESATIESTKHYYSYFSLPLLLQP